ncbi:MAG: PAS domain S-box protein [Candidatus Thiodiazotropha sp.]
MGGAVESICQFFNSLLVTIGIDITDKVEAQLKLLNQKEEFETIFEYSKDGLAILDQESRFLEFNDAFLHMTGYDRQTLRSLSLIELSTPDDMQRTREAFREVRKHGFITHFEVSGQRKDGIPITINMSVVLMPDRVRLLVSAKDMTQDKALREELIAAKQKGDSLLHEQDSLLSLFDKGDSVLFKWKNDAEWHVEYVSDNVQRLLGYYKESFQRGDISYAECIHPHDMTHVYDEVQNAKQNNLDFFKHEAYRIITSEGKVKWILDHTVTQKNSAGEITHFIGYITDISSQKAAETDLIRARDEAQRLFNYTPIPLVYVANNGRVININQKFTEELGYVIEDIPDTQVWFTLAYPDMKYRQRVMETWTQEVIKANEEHRAIPPQEYRVRCKNGDYRTLLISGIFVGQDMIVSFFDMTEVKRSRKALEQAKIAAEKANHAKSAFLANMSHEMRTPLNGIIGLTDIVLNSDLQPVQRGYLEKAQQASHALLTIINDILDYSKIEAGKMDIVPTRFELHSVTKNISSLFGYRIHAKNLSFRVDIDASIPPVLIGDALRLTQILNNLVGNSVKFTESGHIHIDITTLEKTAGAIILGFSIEDTGIGISSEHINKLFQAFEQGDQSTTRRFGGSGLGLMITKQLLNLMGGEITVASEVGSGTVFSFTLPLHYEETSNPDFQQSQEPRQVHRKRLTEVKAALLIEDNETNQLVASLLLEEMGFQVTIARDGKQGIELCRQDPYDIIFMDIQMPVMDGYEASRRIREFNTRIPIIALSAAAMQSDRILSESAGMNQHIAKPIDLRELTRVISEYFELLDVTQELMAFPQQSVHLDCADLEGVMSMINKGVYTVYDMYDNFKNNYRDTLDTLDLPRESKAFGNYIHRLKGVSGNLRIHKIHNLTRSIESGVTIEADIAALKTEMRRVLDKIEEKLSPELQTIVDTANDAPPEILLAQILADVRQTSYIPSEKITSLVHSLETVIDQETREKLLKFYDSFDYAGMETTLNAIDRAMHGE